MGQKLSSKLSFIYSPNSDRFYIFYIPQGSIATQLRCGGMLSNVPLYYKFSTECASGKISEIGQYLTKIWTKLCGLLFWGPPCIVVCQRNAPFVIFVCLYVCHIYPTYLLFTQYSNAIESLYFSRKLLFTSVNGGVILGSEGQMCGTANEE